jgi:hypothetical protein
MIAVNCTVTRGEAAVCVVFNVVCVGASDSTR